ncbi:hypothetical protein Tco_0520203 [Tanacetum coccineum]
MSPGAKAHFASPEVDINKKTEKQPNDKTLEHGMEKPLTKSRQSPKNLPKSVYTEDQHSQNVPGTEEYYECNSLPSDGPESPIVYL